MGIGAAALITFGFALFFGGSACDKIDRPEEDSGDETSGSSGEESVELSTVETSGGTPEETIDSPMCFLEARGNQIKKICLDKEIELNKNGEGLPNDIWNETPCWTNEAGDLTPCIGEGVLTELDFKNMSRDGVRLVRYALTWKRFVKQHENGGGPIEWSEQGFADLQEHLGWAEKYGIYVILDMHIPPGGEQFGERGKGLWENAKDQEIFIALWKEIADRCAGNPTVGGYGLLNEPQPPSDGDWQDLAARTAAAIREVDPKHMLVIANTLVETNNPDWNNPIDPFLVDDWNFLPEFHNYRPDALTAQNAIWTSGYPGADYPAKVLKTSNYLVSYDAVSPCVVKEDGNKNQYCFVSPEWTKVQSSPINLIEYAREKAQEETSLNSESGSRASLSAYQLYNQRTNLFPAAFSVQERSNEEVKGYQDSPVMMPSSLSMNENEMDPNIGHIYFFIWNQAGKEWIRNIKLEKNCSAPYAEEAWDLVSMKNGQWEKKSAIYFYDTATIPMQPPYPDPIYNPPFWEMWFDKPLSDPGAPKQEGNIMAFGNSREAGIISRWLNNYFEIEGECLYRISAEFKGENLGPLSPADGINWNGIGISLSYVAPEDFINWDYNYLETGFKQFVDWAKVNDKPLYLGEFGIIPMEGDDSDLRWMKDMLEITKKYGIYWTHWSYAEGWPEYLGMGLICRNETSDFCKKDAQINLLKEYY